MHVYKHYGSIIIMFAMVTKYFYAHTILIHTHS